MTTQTAVTIAGIEDRGFWGKAHKLSRQFGIAAEDLHSELVLATLEIICESPEIAAKGPGYLLTRATWTVQNMHRYDKNWTHIEEYEQETGNGDNMLMTFFGIVTEDNNFSVAVKQILAELSEVCQNICQMLADGYRKAEIAVELGISRAMVTYNLKKIRAAFEPLLNS